MVSYEEGREQKRGNSNFLKIVYIWLHCAFIAVHGPFPVAASRAICSCHALASHGHGCSLQSTGCRHAGFSGCSGRTQQLWPVGPRARTQQLWPVGPRARTRQLWPVGPRARTRQLWHRGLVALQHVGSSPTRDQTCVPCIGRWILSHCTTREVPYNKHLWLL